MLCDTPHSLFVFPVCTYGECSDVFLVFRFMCELCFLYCGDDCLCVVYEVFSSSIQFILI